MQLKSKKWRIIGMYNNYKLIDFKIESGTDTNIYERVIAIDLGNVRELPSIIIERLEKLINKMISEYENYERKELKIENLFPVKDFNNKGTKESFLPNVDAYNNIISSIARDACCNIEKLFNDTYKEILENKVNAYAEIWYFQNLQIKDLFTENEFMELVKKSSRFVCKTDGEVAYSIKFHTVNQILFKEDEEKAYVYNKVWKEFLNGLEAYMKVQTKKILDELNREVI